MKRGEIYFVHGSKVAQGSEQRRDRHAIIVSNDIGNKYSTVVEVVYLTKKNKKITQPTHVEIMSAEFPSIALCEQVDTVSKMFVGEKLGCVSDDELTGINHALAVSLGIA